MNVPKIVSMLNNIMKLPARYISCDNSARNNNGPIWRQRWGNRRGMEAMTDGTSNTMLAAEARFDVANWKRRLQTLLRADGTEASEDQSDLFS